MIDSMKNRSAGKLLIASIKQSWIFNLMSIVAIIALVSLIAHIFNIKKHGVIVKATIINTGYRYDQITVKFNFNNKTFIVNEGIGKITDKIGDQIDLAINSRNPKKILRAEHSALTKNSHFVLYATIPIILIIGIGFIWFNYQIYLGFKKELNLLRKQRAKIESKK